MLQVKLCLSVFATALFTTLWPATGFSGTCPHGPLRVAIDVGHTKAQPGATSASGKVEFQFNKRFSRELVALSGTSRDLELFILNPQEKPLSLSGRSRLAAEKGADVMVSIHHDSAHDKYMREHIVDGKKQVFTDAFRGFSLFVSRDGADYAMSRKLASLIGRKLKDAGMMQTLHHAEPIEHEGRKILDWELGIYEAPFAVLRAAKSPAVLFEVGVIANPKEEALLELADYRKRVAGAVIDGLKAFCNVGRK